MDGVVLRLHRIGERVQVGFVGGIKVIPKEDRHDSGRRGGQKRVGRGEAIEGRPAWDADSPLRLVWLDEMTPRTILRTSRVGLSLKKLKKSDPPTRFIMRPYRYLSEPRRISTGKQHMVLALHTQGKSQSEIRELTGCTTGAMERYRADIEEGKKEESFDGYFGAELGPKELARLQGLWQAKHGSGGGHGAM